MKAQVHSMSVAGVLCHGFFQVYCGAMKHKGKVLDGANQPTTDEEEEITSSGSRS